MFEYTVVRNGHRIVFCNACEGDLKMIIPLLNKLGDWKITDAKDSASMPHICFDVYLLGGRYDVMYNDIRAKDAQSRGHNLTSIHTLFLISAQDDNKNVFEIEKYGLETFTKLTYAIDRLFEKHLDDKYIENVTRYIDNCIAQQKKITKAQPQPPQQFNNVEVELHAHIKELKDYGLQLKEEKYPAAKYQPVIDLADKISLQLKYHNENNADKEIISKTLEDIIKQGKRDMRHTNRRAFDILAHIAICLTGIGLIALTIKWAITDRFFLNTTTREKKLEQVDSALKIMIPKLKA